MKILIIGGGNMGTTYARSFLRSHIADKDRMMILERAADKAEAIRKLDIGTVYTDPAACLPRADLVILAVKPQDAPLLFDHIRPIVEAQQVFLSIMAGVRIHAIAEGLGVHKIIRAMPNLPAQIGQGMTVFTSSDEVTRIELVTVQNLLNTTGKTLYVDDEDLLDAATAVSGSGPAYVWFFMQAMYEAAREMGFSVPEAELLVYQTFRGAVDLYNKADHSFEEWIRRVASKGGTTEAALHTYESAALLDHIKAGLQAALQRAIELGRTP